MAAANWTVHLVKPCRENDFREGFFPRSFHYKRDVQELLDEVERKGGIAILKVSGAAAARKMRDEALRDLGLTKVRGHVSGETYWE